MLCWITSGDSSCTLPKTKYQPNTDRLRNYQISNSMEKLQILNGYMQLIVSSVLVLNDDPEKYGLGTIKRANP
jgi:hypothetical protein